MRKRIGSVLCLIGVALTGCAGPHGERPYLDNAVVRPNSTPYSFSGGYFGATAGSGPKNDPGAAN